MAELIADTELFETFKARLDLDEKQEGQLRRKYEACWNILQQDEPQSSAILQVICVP
jgi:hypothetical protein